jgi:hypothetical protein
MKLNTIISYLAFLMLFSLALSGCASQPQTQHVQKQVQIAAVTPPPPPPTPKELAQKPYIPKNLMRAQKDPFVPLSSSSGVISSSSSTQGEVASGEPVVTGVLTDGERSAIIQIGSRSHVVHEGEVIDKYRVLSISDKGVMVIGSSGRKFLPLPQLK